MTSKITFLGYRDEKEWKHYAWLFTLNGVSFEYKTGSGQATPKFNKWGGYASPKKPENTINCEDTKSWVKIPSADEILHCLVMDAQSGEMSFDDFCSDFGYDNDSIKALDVYRACMEAKTKLRKALGKDYNQEIARIQALEI